ncbi:MAG: DNA-packaging protein [Acidobacteria bacterium]|nr:DNA-packaging protein [Acidobacteriota bacterium]
MTAVPIERLLRLRELQDAADDAQLLPHQRPPATPFDVWLLEGSRGCAKTWGLAHYLARFMRHHRGARARIISPTLGDAIEALVEGPSGVKAADSSAKWLPSAPGGSKLVWPNTSECLVLGTPTAREVDRLRASGNRHLDIWDEAAANPCLGLAWEQAAYGRRLGIDGIPPHSVIGTTPRPSKAYRALRKQAIDAGTYTHATMRDNPYLSPEWIAQMEALYAGTRMGRQELGGELLEDIEGAMWTLGLIDTGRVKTAPDMEKVVVGVDPSGGGPDDQGIIVCGRAAKHYYVLADYTCHLSPEGWGRRVLQAYDEHKADLIVYEKNYGGEMVAATIRNAATMSGRPCPPLKEVWASRGKRLRAEPIAALYGDPENLETSQPRVHHVGLLARLEDEQLTFTGDAGEQSPNRLDALVFAATELVESNYAIGTFRVPGTG